VPAQRRSEKFARGPGADSRSAKAQSVRGIRSEAALTDFSVARRLAARSIQGEIIDPVEHLCPRCNSSVDDTTPFCPNCEAAQVRATAKEYSRSPVTVAVEGAPGFSTDAHLPRLRTNADARSQLRAAFYAAIVAAVLSAVQPKAGFVLALPVGGFLSVLLYRRLSSGSEPTPRAGFRLGAFTGLFAFGLLMIVMAAESFALHTEVEAHAQVVQTIQQAQARNTDPQAKQVFEFFMTPQGMAFMLAFGFVFMGVLFVVLSGVGGAISAALLRQKAPPGQ
jgi:hypothetical protein